MKLEERIRTIPDFPVKGIMFRDIAPLLESPEGLREAVERMAGHWAGRGIVKVAAMEARGFVFGAAIALRLGAGFVLVRKPGKLPFRTRSISYHLEYRSDVLHIHEDAIQRGDKVLVVDDLLATGGTARAVVDLVEQLGGTVEGISVLIELVGLHGRQMLPGREIRSEIVFEGD